MHNMSILDKVAYILVIIGALNWGLVGALNFNLVSAVFGGSVVTRTVYILVGLAALYLIIMKASHRMPAKSSNNSGSAM